MKHLRRILPFAVTAGLALACLSASFAQQERTRTLYITLHTRTTPGMAIPNLPPGLNIPGLSGGTTKSIDGRAVYANRAVDPIFLTVPADLKLPNNRLVLAVPKPADATPDKPEKPDTPGEEKEMTVTVVSKLYWHPEKAEGPITEEFTGKTTLGAGPMGGAPNLARLAEDREAEKEATGDKTPLPPAVVGSGDYVLNTGGMAPLDGFLPALKVSAPESINKVEPAEGFKLKWDPVAGARGYIIHCTGMNFEETGDNATKMTTTVWVSTRDEPPARVRYGYAQATTISDDLAAGILLPGDTTECVVPPGMFEDVMMFTVEVIAVGNDFYSSTDGLTVFGRIRSEWSAQRMAGMGNMGGDDDEGDE